MNGKEVDKYEIYVDGSCNNKTKENGGIGVYIKVHTKDGKLFTKKIAGGRYSRTTNNRMELLAAITAMRAIEKSHKTTIISDSQYVVDSYNEGRVDDWEANNFSGAKNPDLWRMFLEEVRKFHPTDIKFVWVKGHNKNNGNEWADHLAGVGALMDTVIIDEGSEIPLRCYYYHESSDSICVGDANMQNEVGIEGEFLHKLGDVRECSIEELKKVIMEQGHPLPVRVEDLDKIDIDLK